MRITQIQRIYGTQRYGYLCHTDTTDSTEKYSACTDGGKEHEPKVFQSRAEINCTNHTNLACTANKS